MPTEDAQAARRPGGQPPRRPAGAGNSRNSEEYLPAHRSPLTAHPSPLTRLVAGLRTVLGMPNYAAYRAHLADHHPDRTPLSEREFFAEYLNTRYNGGPTRCC